MQLNKIKQWKDGFQCYQKLGERMAIFLKSWRTHLPTLLALILIITMENFLILSYWEATFSRHICHEARQIVNNQMLQMDKKVFFISLLLRKMLLNRQFVTIFVFSGDFCISFSILTADFYISVVILTGDFFQVLRF